MSFYEENIFILPGGEGEWDEVSDTPITHLTHWEDFAPELRPRTNRTVNSATRKRILERDHHQCRVCGSEDDLEVDHIIAVAWGGSDEDDNLQILCRICNKEKGPQAYEVRRLEQEGQVISIAGSPGVGPISSAAEMQNRDDLPLPPAA